MFTQATHGLIMLMWGTGTCVYQDDREEVDRTRALPQKVGRPMTARCIALGSHTTLGGKQGR